MFFYMLFLGEHRVHIFRGVVCVYVCTQGFDRRRGDRTITASSPQSLCLSYVSF